MVCLVPELMGKQFGGVPRVPDGHWGAVPDVPPVPVPFGPGTLTTRAQFGGVPVIPVGHCGLDGGGTVPLVPPVLDPFGAPLV